MQSDAFKKNNEALSHLGQTFTIMNVSVDVKTCTFMKDENILDETCFSLNIIVLIIKLSSYHMQPYDEWI